MSTESINLLCTQPPPASANGTPSSNDVLPPTGNGGFADLLADLNVGDPPAASDTPPAASNGMPNAKPEPNTAPDAGTVTDAEAMSLLAGMQFRLALPFPVTPASPSAPLNDNAGSAAPITAASSGPANGTGPSPTLQAQSGSPPAALINAANSQPAPQQNRQQYGALQRPNGAEIGRVVSALSNPPTPSDASSLAAALQPVIPAPAVPPQPVASPSDAAATVAAALVAASSVPSNDSPAPNQPARQNSPPVPSSVNAIPATPLVSSEPPAPIPANATADDSASAVSATAPAQSTAPMSADPAAAPLPVPVSNGPGSRDVVASAATIPTVVSKDAAGAGKPPASLVFPSIRASLASTAGNQGRSPATSTPATDSPTAVPVAASVAVSPAVDPAAAFPKPPSGQPLPGDGVSARPAAPATSSTFANLLTATAANAAAGNPNSNVPVTAFGASPGTATVPATILQELALPAAKSEQTTGSVTAQPTDAASPPPNPDPGSATALPGFASQPLAAVDQPQAAAPSEAPRAALADQLSGPIASAYHEQRQMRVRLSPPELGQVIVDVNRHDGGVITARIESQVAQTHQLLSDHLPALRDALSQQGIPVDRIDFVHTPSSTGDSTSGYLGQSPQQQQQRSDNQPQTPPWREPRTTRNATSQAEPRVPVRSISYDSSGLDVTI